MAESLVLPNIFALVHPSGDLSKLFLQERWKPDSDPINSGKNIVALWYSDPRF